MPIEFFIPHEVAPKQSDKSRIVFVMERGKLVFQANGKPKAWIQHYQPTAITKNAQALAALCSPHAPDVPFDCPMRLELVFQYPWPSHSTRRFREKARPKKTAPDTEQLEKQVKDVLQATGFVTNDSRFADVHVRKLWTDAVGVQVYMEEIEA